MLGIQIPQGKPRRGGRDDLKSFDASQRIRLSSGKGAAHQPEVSVTASTVTTQIPK